MTGLLRDGERLLGMVLIAWPLAVAVAIFLAAGQAVYTLIALAGHGRRDWRKGPEGWQ